ncbi:MAG TPA: tetratricopeptide repeat protein [Candidatus Acidoferrales bacterium]|nr:tetratricopeptide repeat protein [Candidatus Acidoferrales bacterium]
MDTIAPSPALRRYFPVALLIVAAILIWQASEIWVADYRMETGRPAELTKSVALIPGNAEAWDRLGRYYLLSFANPDVAQAISDFQRAVKVDPLSGNYWLDLASAYDANGNTNEAQDAYAEAHKVYPTSAIVDWNYGNFLLREGKQEQAYEQIQRAVSGDSSLLTLAMSRVWHSSRDVNQMLDHVIPADVDSYFTALDFFSRLNEVPPGLAVWQRLVALKQPIGLVRTYNFFFILLRSDDNQDALRVWNDAVAAAGEPGLAVQGESLVSDGRFENAFPNGGLGWTWQTELGAAIDFDDSTPNGKGRSVRLDFNGGVNANIRQPFQYVAVEPGRTYHFHAAIRTSEISTESGMRFLVDDPFHGGMNLQSPNLTGTHRWTNVDFDVATTPRTHFLVIELFRDPSKRFDNKLSGSVWVADVSLEPAEGGTGPTQ